MNLPEPPLAHEGFFASNFFTMSDQDKSKAFNTSLEKRRNTYTFTASGNGPTRLTPHHQQERRRQSYGS